MTAEERATGTALIALLIEARDTGLWLDFGELVARARAAAYLRVTTEPDEDSVLPTDQGW